MGLNVNFLRKKGQIIKKLGRVAYGWPNARARALSKYLIWKKKGIVLAIDMINLTIYF
jgi:hypothetical protein